MRSTSRDFSKWLPQIAQLGVHELRSGNIAQIDYVNSLGVRSGEILYGKPKDDTLDKPGTLPVKDLDAWKRMVTEHVKAANGRVKYWEVWNEPPNGTGKDQTPADYGHLVAATYDAVKAVDPTAKVGFATKSVDVNYLELALQGGTKGKYDYIVYHPYEVLDGDRREYRLRADVSQHRERHAQDAGRERSG